MLTGTHLQQLLEGSLTDEEAKRYLLGMLPELIDQQQFSDVVEQLMGTADPSFAGLSEYADRAIDCCGTGGSGLPRFNTSTAVAFVLAAAGVKVAKFGNRAASGRSGSFDVLSHLGVPAEVSPQTAERLLDECNLVFLFAPQVYPALSRLAPIRKALGRTTVLNFVGPLLNPVHPTRRLVGVSDARMHGMVAEVLSSKPSTKLACVVRSSCGLDEVCHACDYSAKFVGGSSWRSPQGDSSAISGLTPAATEQAGSCGLTSAATAPTPEENAKSMVSIFNGEDTSSNNYELICKNAALALLIAGAVQNYEAGLSEAQRVLASGKVKEQLKKVVEGYARYGN